MDKLKILVIDDKRVIGDFFGFTLGYSGHDITCVHNIRDAVEAVKKDKFDIAFIDIVMPGKDGVAILEEIKRIAPQLPVVMMSGFSVEEKRRQALALGAVQCLKKPFEVEDVRRVVKDTIGKEI